MAALVKLRYGCIHILQLYMLPATVKPAVRVVSSPCALHNIAYIVCLANALCIGYNYACISWFDDLKLVIVLAGGSRSRQSSVEVGCHTGNVANLK